MFRNTLMLMRNDHRQCKDMVLDRSIGGMERGLRCAWEVAITWGEQRKSYEVSMAKVEEKFSDVTDKSSERHGRSYIRFQGRGIQEDWALMCQKKRNKNEYINLIYRLICFNVFSHSGTYMLLKTFYGIHSIQKYMEWDSNFSIQCNK